MNKKFLWTISLICLTIYLFFWNYYVKPFDFSDFFEAIEFISTLLTVLIFATILALLIGLIPFKQLKYKNRLASTFPIGIIVACILFGLTFYSSGPHYQAIRTEPNADCNSVHDGLFKFGKLIINRKGNTQTEINTVTNKKEEFSVYWLSDCEYELTSLTATLKVKIVSADKNGYDCYVWHKGRTSKRLKITRQNNAY